MHPAGKALFGQGFRRRANRAAPDQSGPAGVSDAARLRAGGRSSRSRGMGPGVTHIIRRKSCRKASGGLLQRQAEGREIAGEGGVVDLGTLGRIGDDHRNADTAAEIAYQAEQGRALVAVARRQRGKGQRRQRHEDEPSPRPCVMPVRTKLAPEVSVVKRVISHSDRLVRIRPSWIRWRGSALPDSRPTVSIAIMVPMPRSASGTFGPPPSDSAMRSRSCFRAPTCCASS